MQRCANFVSKHRIIQQWRGVNVTKKWKMVTKTVGSTKKNNQQQQTEYYYSMAKWDENWITDFIYRIYRGQFISNRIRVNKCDNHKLCKMLNVFMFIRSMFNACIVYNVYTFSANCVHSVWYTHKFHCRSEHRLEKHFSIRQALPIHCDCVQCTTYSKHSKPFRAHEYLI